MTLESISSIFSHVLPDPYAGLLSAIVFGTKATLSPDLKDALTITGTLHIVALSGMNITILASFISVLFLPFISRRVASLLIILLIILFVGFVGPSASIIRAAIMGCIGYLCTILGKPKMSLYLWCIAVVVMLVIHISWLTDVSFQLSALASLGMILFGQTKERHTPDNALSPSNSAGLFRVLLVSFWQLIAVDLHETLAAQSLTLPILFFQFHRLSLVSPITNILISWTVGPITILGLLIGFGGTLWFPIAQLLCLPAFALLHYLISVVFITSQFPLASIQW